MKWGLRITAGLAGIIHIYFFVMESVLWGTERVNRLFHVTAAEAKLTRLMAFNQGFYNLFLAVGVLLGLVLLARGHRIWGAALVAFGCACMFGAALVLLFSAPHMLKGVFAQGLPSSLGLLCLYLWLRQPQTDQ